MNFVTKRSFIMKLIIAIFVVVFLFNTISVNYSYGLGVDIGGVLFKPFFALAGGVLMAINGLIALFLGGADTYLQLIGDDPDFGQLLASPEHIFAGNYAILDANIFDAKVNESLWSGLVAGFNQGPGAVLVGAIKEAISGIYIILRNTCAIALLCLLIYAGIRIVLASNSPQEQGKWKAYLYDWLKGLFLVIFIDLLMIGVFYVTDLIKAAFNDTLTHSSSIASLCAAAVTWKSWEFQEQMIALIMFGYVTYLTIIFTFAYYKRLVWTTMLIVIAPVVAVVYPLNGSAYNGKGIFDKWLKEFIMNAAIPIFHIVIYYVLTILPIQIASSASTTLVDVGIFSLSTFNPFIMAYALFSMSMIRPAERFFRRLFDIKGEVANMGTYDSGKKTMRAVEDVIKKIGMLAAVVVTGGAAAAAAPAVAGGAAAGAAGGTAAGAAGGTAAGATGGAVAGVGAEGASLAGIGEGAGAIGETGLLGEGAVEESMLDIYDDGFGSNNFDSFDNWDLLNEWNPQERDYMARQTNQGQSLHDTYNDEDLRNMGLDEDQIKQLDGESTSNEKVNQVDNVDSDKGEQNKEITQKGDGNDTIVGLLQDIKTILETGKKEETFGNTDEEIKLNDSIDISDINLEDGLSGDNTKLDMSNLAGFGENVDLNLEEGKDSKNFLKDSVERIMELRSKYANWRDQHPELVDAMSDVVDSIHGVTDTMYTDPITPDWVNDRWHRGKKDRQESFEMHANNYVNDSKNIKIMMDKHHLVDKYRESYRKANPRGIVDEEKVMEDAKNKAKEMLKQHQPFLKYGINDVNKADELRNYQKDNGVSAKDAIRGYANSIRADAVMTQGIKTYMVQNHEHVQTTINGAKQDIDVSKIREMKSLNAEQIKELDKAVQEIKDIAKDYERIGNSQERAIQYATLERNMANKGILKNLGKDVSKTDYVKKTYDAIEKMSKTNDTVKLKGSEDSINIRDMEQLLNSEINKKRDFDE